MRRAAIQRQRTYRAPQAFNDLVAPVLAFFPPRAAAASMRDLRDLRLAVDAAVATGGKDWPPPAARLLARAVLVATRKEADIPTDLFNDALAVNWPREPLTYPPSWQLRRDLGGPDDEDEWPDSGPAIGGQDLEQFEREDWGADIEGEQP
jgi:hypothetical protein